MTPKCPYFGTCGGCAFQDIEYSKQLEEKRRIIEEAIGKPVNDIFYGEPYGYRNRVDMVFTPEGLGFRKKGNWRELVAVEQCAIANLRINEIVKEVKEYFCDIDAFDVRKRLGTYRFALIRTPRLDSGISFVLNEESPRLSEAEEKVEAFAKISSAENVYITYISSRSGANISPNYRIVRGSEYLKEEILGKTFYFTFQGFFQTNSEMVEKMHSYVHSIIQDSTIDKTHLLDLYGGVGTFGIINAGLFKNITIVEVVKEAIEAAQKNIEENQAKNVVTQTIDATKLNSLNLSAPLTVITDPPRSGMDPKTVDALKKLSPKRIIYISCNPAQIPKDLQALSNYEVGRTALFDFFPHTPHMEAVVELRANS